MNRRTEELGKGLFTSLSRFQVGTWIRGRDDPEASFIIQDATDALCDKVSVSGVSAAVQRFRALEMLRSREEVYDEVSRLRFSVIDSPGWEVFDGAVKMILRLEQSRTDSK